MVHCGAGAEARTSPRRRRAWRRLAPPGRGCACCACGAAGPRAAHDTGARPSRSDTPPAPPAPPSRRRGTSPRAPPPRASPPRARAYSLCAAGSSLAQASPSRPPRPHRPPLWPRHSPCWPLRHAGRTCRKHTLGTMRSRLTRTRRWAGACARLRCDVGAGSGAAHHGDTDAHVLIGVRARRRRSKGRVKVQGGNGVAAAVAVLRERQAARRDKHPSRQRHGALAALNRCTWVQAWYCTVSRTAAPLAWKSSQQDSRLCKSP